MDFVEKIADKVVPALILAMIGALFTMYMDIAFLKAKAIDYKQRADKLHDKMERDLKECTKNDIIQFKDIEYIKGK